MVLKQCFYIIALLLSLIGFSQDDARGSVGTQTNTSEIGVKRAIIVGISNYTEDKLKLKYAENDAALFRDYLSKVEKLPEENIVYLGNEDAVAPNIVRELSAILKKSQEGDLVYFYFAGHGDVVDDFGEKEGFLLAADANANQEYYAGGVIPLDLLNNKVVGNLTNKGVKVILILDACHSGFIFEEGTQKNLGTIQAMFENATKILSCGANELSYESGDLQHGYFTYYLVKGLMGTADANTDNNLIYRELDDYLYNNVNATVSKKHNKQQTPILRTQNDRATLKTIAPNDNLIAFDDMQKQLKTNQGIASRNVGITRAESSELNHPLVKKFNTAIEMERYHGSDNSAFEIYLSAKKSHELSEGILNKMQSILIRDLSSSAQQLINDYIDGTTLLPQGREFQKQARNLEVCLELLEKDNLIRDRIYTSKLLLEAYSTIRSKSYAGYKTAKKKLQEGLKIEPRAAYIHNALGTVYNYEETYDSAHYHFNEAKKLIGTWSTPNDNLAENWLDQYQYEEAKTQLEQSLGLNGNHVNTYIQLGELNEKQGKYQEAETYYKKALEVDSKNTSALRKMSGLQQTKGNLNTASEWYHRAIKADSINTVMETGLLNYIEKNNLDNATAEKLLLNAIDYEPDYSSVYTQYADYLRLNNDKLARLKLADSLYGQAISKDPHNAWAYAGRGWLYQDLRRTAKANQVFQEGIKNNPNKPDAYYYYANFLKGNHDFSQAETYYKQAIGKDPLHLPTYTNLIDLYTTNNQQGKSFALLNELTQKYPKAPDFWNLLGNTYFSKNEYSKAIDAFNQAIALDASYAKSYTNLGYSELQTNQYESAKKNYLRANNSNPYANKTSDIAEAIIGMAKSKENFGAPDDVEQLYRLASELDDTAKSGLPYAHYLYLKGDAKTSYETTENLLSKTDATKWQIDILELLVKCAIDNNAVSNADKYFTQLINKDKNPDLLLAGVYSIFKGDQQKGYDLIRHTNPEILRSTKLKGLYSQHTIETYILN